MPLGYMDVTVNIMRLIGELIGEYRNGNYRVTIFDDGTKIRETDADRFIAVFPECLDVKITNYCDMGCPYCHENSTTEEDHGDILNAEFIGSLRPFTEIAIGGGNPLSHPDLFRFLEKLKDNGIIANMTVNQKHFLGNISILQELIEDKLIRGLGISLVKPTDEFIQCVKLFPTAVLHVINGVADIEDMHKLYDHNLKVLILGYKQLRRGSDYYSETVKARKEALYKELPSLINRFEVVSFDNLAINQLDVQRLMSKEQWDEFYMGDDGQFTMYVDLVTKEFAKSSTSPTRYELLSDIEDMFKIIQSETRR